MTLKQLKEKRAALLKELDGDVTAERLTEIKTELEKIKLAFDTLLSEEAEAAADRSAEQSDAEKRTARPAQKSASDKPDDKGMRMSFNLGTTTTGADAPKPLTKAEELRFTKSALGKELRAMLTSKDIPYTETEKRALGVAFTTTSETYSAPTAGADGVNNGGIFIRDNVMFDLLQLDEFDSPFLRDCAPTFIKGATIFPYVEQKQLPAKTARGKAEKAPADDLSIKWGKLSLPIGNYPLTIEVTMELLAMTDEAFAEYFLAELKNEMNFLLGDEVFYGSGTDDRIEGVTIGAIQGDPYDDPRDGIKTAFGTLSKRARKNAKLYISYSLSLDMAFEKDSEDRPLFPIYNNATGIESIVKVPVEVDDGLADGSFLFGNARNYKLNFIKQTEVYSELHGKTRVIESTAHLMVAGKAAPNYFYYGTKTTTP